jgi:molybdopterin converting factor small subunit
MMNRVTIELWLWLGDELKGEFESPSKMRSIRVEETEEGTTIRQLLQGLAKRYLPIAETVFDMKNDKLYPYVVLNYNDRVISPYELYDRVLKDGDKITVLPMFFGG